MADQLEQFAEFFQGLSYCAYEKGMEMHSPRQLEDGFIEVVFHDKQDSEMEMSIDFKDAGFFNGSHMLAVRAFDMDKDLKWAGTRLFYVSAIPYVLFGSLYCEV